MDWELVRGVSRSFYLTLRLLPREVRGTMALGYLLARASDTIADTSHAPRAQRIAVLQGLLANPYEPRNFDELAAAQMLPNERLLLTSMPALQRQLAESPDQKRLEWVWMRILVGQLFDLERFERNSEPLTRNELDEYIYLVAGCVGEFWTRVCAERVDGFSRHSTDMLVQDAIRFGKGLQLVNILRDRLSDTEVGRVYVSDEDYTRVWRQAHGYLDAGVRWVRRIDSGHVRYACIVPLRLGFATLRLLEPKGGRSVKVSRARVRGALLCALPALVWRRGG